MKKYNLRIFTVLSSLLWVSYFVLVWNNSSSIIFFLTYPLFISALNNYKRALFINLTMLGLFVFLTIYYPYSSGNYSFIRFNEKVGTVYLMITVISAIWKRYNQSNVQQIQELALYDNLTGVANRRNFDLYTENLISACGRKNRCFSLLYIDIDNFKKINDNFGHDEGDEVLKKVVRNLKRNLRASDFISRNGGDEFLVILPEIDDDFSPAMIADRILHNRDENDHIPSLSIGIANYPDDASSMQELMEKADHAMYHAKKNGKNNFSFFHEGFDQKVHERFAIASELKQAIENEELDVVFQPKIDTNTKTITGAEALIRWNNALLGSVSPADFISIAEDSDIIHKISTWVYLKAFKMLKKVHDLGHKNLMLSVNVSPCQISRETLMDSLNTAIVYSGVSPEYIELEITEGTLLQNDEHSAALFHSLREKGFKIAIDDFGTGYSSLSYLQKMNIDSIKIDQSFIHNIENNNAFRITEAIISIAKALNLQTVAEGVETTEQMEMLNKMGCDLIQGFYYSKPLSEDVFLEMIEKEDSELNMNYINSQFVK